jgi:hypothetical protein
MTQGHGNHTPHSPNKGYETRDVKVGALGKWLLVLALVIVGTYALTVGLFRFFSGREAAKDVAAGAAPPASAQPAPADEQLKWPEPRIQAAPADDMARLRAEHEAVLRSYAWVDREAGVVRVPIDVAMKLVLEEGLPVRQPETAPPATGTPDPVKMPAGGSSEKTTK